MSTFKKSLKIPKG